MSRLKSDDLYKLIQSLTKEEKRYIKLFAKSVGKQSAIHIKIFDILDKQSSYDEAELKRKLVRQHLGTQLPTHKQYLYQFILKALQNMPSTATVEDDILNGLRQLKILARKSLIDQAEVLLDKLLEDAVQFEKIYYLPRLYEWQFTLQIMSRNFANWTYDELQAKLQTYQQSAHAIVESILYRANAYLAGFVSQHKPPVFKELGEAQWFEQHTLPKPTESNLYAIWGYTQFEVLRHARANDWASMIDLWNAYLVEIDKRESAGVDWDVAQRLTGTLLTIMLLSLEINDDARFDMLWQRFRNLPAAYASPLHWLRVAELHLLYCQRRGLWERGAATIKLLQTHRVESLLSVADKHNPRYYFWRLALAMFCISVGQLDEAEQALGNLAELDAPSLQIFVVHVRLAHLLIAYQRQAYPIVIYQADSFYRLLQTYKDAFEWERTLIRGLRRLAMAADVVERRAVLVRWRKRLLKLYTTQAHTWTYNPLYYFDYFVWLDSHYFGQSIEGYLADLQIIHPQHYVLRTPQ